MTVLQLPIPSTSNPTDGADGGGPSRAVAIAANASPRRNTPSPVKSAGSTNYISTTPVTSNRAQFLGNGRGGAPNGSAAPAVHLDGGQGFPGPFLRQQQPASFLQLPGHAPPSGGAAAYPNNVPGAYAGAYAGTHAVYPNVGPGTYAGIANVSAAGAPYASHVLLQRMQPRPASAGNHLGNEIPPPPADAAGANVANPPWNRMGGAQGTFAMQGGTMSNNRLGTVMVGGAGAAVGNMNRGNMANRQSASLLGNVQSAGQLGDAGAAFGSRGRLTNNQSANLLGTVTVGGAPAAAATGLNGRKGVVIAGGGRFGGPPPARPPLLPPTPNKHVEFVGSSEISDAKGDYNGDAEFGPEAPSLMTCVPEVALTSDLVTLSVHEALTFDGVELALHPDIFAKSAGKKEDAQKALLAKQRLRPGDLVEIRVWSARPGVAIESSSQSTSSKAGSAMKSKLQSGPRPSLHSRNTSLATVSSSLTNASLMATPRPLATKGGMMTLPGQPPPPLPKVVGGRGLSSIGVSPDGASGELFGENLIQLDTPNQAPAKNTPNISSVLSDAASNLFRRAGAPQGDNSDSSSALAHSRDSSLATNSTLGELHSRDSSLLTTSASWMNALNGTTSKDGTPQISPTIGVMDPVSEGGTLPQPHPLTSNLSNHSVPPSPESQILPMRRDTSPLKAAAPTVGPPPPPPPPPHPLSSSTLTQTSGSSTPSHPSSPAAPTPVPTPPVLNAMAGANATAQRPPMVPHSADPTPSSSPVRQAGVVLSPENTTPSDPRQRASTADAPAPLGRRPGEAAPSHTRNHSTLTAATPAVGSGSIPTHRRIRSNVTADSDPTQSAQLLPPSQKGKTAMKTTDRDGIRDIHEMLQATHFVRVSFVIPVSERSISSIKSGARTQVSLLRQVADLYNITAYDTVTVTSVPRSKTPFVQQSINADFLTVTFKDQFVSRGDMYNFQKQLLRDWVYEGKRLNFNGIRTYTKVIRHGDHVVRSGLISEDTKLTFRSRSARIIWLVQMSSEMWEFASPFNTGGNHHRHESSCKLYFDKFVEFARRLFDKWKKLQLTHNLTVMFFSRTCLRHQDGDSSFARTPSSAVHVDSDGRVYEDHYKIVVENETGTSSWDSLIHRMKKEFVAFPKGVGWDLARGKERTPSTASQGNILEAVNITLNLLHLHYIDRDLHRTGNSIVIITPGSGVFEIDKNLAGITKQRMMDNGIGSDMLSLGLPPLHVAPFFLFKEKSTSTAEEILGFDEYKTYFEVPHWMNLSYVDYDNEDEEPVLYKEDLDLDEDATTASALQKESEALAQSWRASNGFLKRHAPNLIAPKVTPDTTNPTKQHYRHLISGRGFEDILQACRPRNRGDYGSGLPVSLTMLLQKAKPNGNVDSKDAADRRAKPTRADGESRQLVRGEQLLTPQRPVHASRSRYLEWGAVDFDDLTLKRQNNARQTQRSRSPSDSQSSPASSFASFGSYKFPAHFLGASHLQSTTSLDGGHSESSGGGEHATTHKKRGSDGSLATLDDEDMHNTPEISSSKRVSSILQLMAEHDKSTFSSSATPKKVSKDNGIAASPDGSQRNSFNDSFGPESPRERNGIMRAQSAVFPAQQKGGIEAALVQYDVTNRKREQRPNKRDRLVNAEVAVRPSLATSPLSIGMPFSLDRRSEGLRPSTMRLVAPDLIPEASKLDDNAAEGFLPLETRTNSMIKIKSKDGYIQSKMIAITKEGRLGDRRNSHRETRKDGEGKKSNHRLHSIASGTTGGHRHHDQTASAKKKHHSRKSHHRHYRHQRKQWVLNPFRQEDEDEVLAKRTHNRRRWSHVFPLGEDEFKRHAGPNWKSLCQPAILPMTIDFHPPQQELEDIKKFSVKSYSVTLPPMGETTYNTHAELLGDLLTQRMRQDFQIVPQNIIQQSARRDGAENVLEATLSMGHKIQRLSYNPSTDSVDVVQYYARFAEDETPQTYRYLLWSTLRQDYESVFQTFTKYTLPYKWNELDMLISGDAVTTIHEGMRYPRISFVIIPDPFSDINGEKEYSNKFHRLVEYFVKLQPKDEAKNMSIEMHTRSDGGYPRASSGDKRFIVDLRKKRDDKFEWMELVHDGNCDTRRTFRMTIQWLVAVASKIDQQAQLLQRRCTQYGLKLVSVPHFSCLRSCFMNPFAVPLTTPILNKSCVDAIEKALTDIFSFVYDGTHMSDPNEIDSLDGFEFEVNKWSIKKKKKFVPARQYLHRSGTLFTRLLRDTKGSAIVIIYLNRRHISGDEQRLHCARMIFRSVEKFIADSIHNIA